jgi:hypothetical protein
MVAPLIPVGLKALGAAAAYVGTAILGLFIADKVINAAKEENETDRWGVKIDPEAVRLSEGHRAAAGNRSDARYGGNCTPDEYDKLHDAYKEKCKVSDMLGKCSPDMMPADKAARIAAFGRCARAREDIMNKCFAGGDYEHREQAGQKWEAVKNCGK